MGREPVGDYLALAQGLGTDRNRAVIEDALDHLNYIEEYLVTDSDRESYRAWLRQYLSPIMKDVGWESKPGESDEQKALRARVFYALGYDARDPDALAEASKLAEKALDNPASVSHEMAANAFRLAALNGDQTLYDKLLALLKNATSPEEYYMALFALPHFDNPKLLERTLDFAISPDVRSQDALRLIGNVMQNPAGEKLAWESTSIIGTQCKKPADLLPAPKLLRPPVLSAMLTCAIRWRISSPLTRSNPRNELTVSRSNASMTA